MKAEELAVAQEDCWRNIAIALIDPRAGAWSAPKRRTNGASLC